MAGENQPEPIEFGIVRAYPKADRIPRNGLWYWVIRTSGRGGRHLECVWATREEAQKRCAQWDATERGDTRPPPPPRGTLTAGKILRTWLATYIARPDLDEATLKVARLTSNHLLNVIDRFAATDVQAIAHAFLTERRAAGAASSTIQRQWRVLRQAWAAWMVNDRSLPELPKSLDLTPRRVYTSHTPTDGDVARVLAFLRERVAKRVNGARWICAALEVAWETGMRIGEIESVTWGQVSFEDRTLRIRGKRSGGTAHREGRWRTFPMHDELIEVLRAWRDEQWPDGPPGPHETLLGRKAIARHRGWDLLQKACDAVGVPRFSWHGVRRRVVRRLRQAQMHPADAAALLGHSPVVMMTIYDEVDTMELAGRIPSARRPKTKE